VLIDVRRSPLLPALLSLAYIVAPVRDWGWLEGRPLGVLSTAALAAVCWLWAGPHRDELRRTWYTIAIAGALLLKVGVGPMLIVPRGFDARYYANSRFEPPVQPSAESWDPSFTRVDRRLRFGVDGSPDVPVAFFNELRYSYYRETEPRREGLPFSVMWQGFWRVTEAGRQRLYAHSPGGDLSITIGDTFSEHIDRPEAWTSEVDLPAGYHRVMIAWSIPQDGARGLDVGRVVDGQEAPFDDRVILRRRAGTFALVGGSAARAVSRMLDTALLAWLLLQTARGVGRSWRSLSGGSYNASDAIAIVWMFGVLDALIFAAPAIGRMVTLSGGDDWLTYESYARDIVLHGPLMRGGEALGQGTPFFAQPFYAYFLAACHWLFGDGLFGIYFVQRLGVTATIVGLWRAAVLVFDEKAGLAVLVTGVAVAYQKLAGWSSVLLTEVAFAPLVAWWAYLLMRVGKTTADRATSERYAGLAVAAGAVGAIATLTRSTLLTGWIMALPLVAIAIPARRLRVTTLALLISTMLAVSSLATVRNWVVAHRLVLITTEGPPTLLQGNPPPPLLDTPPAVQKWYDRFDVDPRTQKVFEFVRQQPWQFAAGLGRKAQYTLGWFGTLLDGAPTSRFYIATWAVAAAGVVLLPWLRPVSVPLALVPLALAASHFLALVLIMPQVYVDRMIVPMYLLLVPYAAIPAAALAKWGAHRRLAAAVAIALLGAAVLKIMGQLPAVDFDVLATTLLAAGVCVAGLPTVRPWPLLAYAMFGIALTIGFVRAPSAESAAMFRTGTLFIATALASELLLEKADRYRAAIVWTCFALAALGAVVLLRMGLPSDVLEQFTVSLRYAFGYLSSYAAAAGLVLASIALVVRSRAPHVQRALIYAAGATLMVPALHWVGAMIMPNRALLHREMAMLGAIGVAAYVAIWIDAAWPNGHRIAARACQGLALGMFITILFGTVISHAGVAPTIAAGFLIGVIQAERGAVQPVRSP